MPQHHIKAELLALPDKVVVSLAGEIDLATAPVVMPVLDRALERATTEGLTVVVDLRGVDFMDSTGVHLLTGLADRSRSAVRVQLLAGTPAVETVLQLVGSTDVLPRADPAALASRFAAVT